MATPYIVDDFFINDDIQKLKSAYGYNSELSIFMLFLALVEYQNSEWFYKQLYSSGLFEIFKIFPITEPFNLIKELILFDGTTSVVALERVLSAAFGVDGWALSLGVAGEIIVNIKPTLFGYELALSDSNVLVTNEDDNLIMVLPDDFELSQENLFVLQNFVASGVKLTITFEQ